MEFEIQNLKSQNDAEVWDWRLKLTFEIDIWNWRLKLTFGIQIKILTEIQNSKPVIRIWNLKLKYKN